MEIIVGSDGSDDGTNEIVRGYADQGVRLVDLPRRGKIPTLNAAVEHATGRILVFSDANSMFASESLRRLVAPFADQRVGAVAGNQRYRRGAANTASIGERLYWSFDRALKRMQSRSGSAIAATGAIHAIRPEAVAYESTAASDGAEFARRTRIIVRGLRALWVLRRLFNPLRYGFYSVQLASHKLLRWSGGWVLVTLLVSSIVLWREGWIYGVACLAQLLLYAAAAAALALRNTRWRWLTRPLALPYYFSLVNLATLRAWMRIVRGRRIEVWDSHRPVAAREST
jgi:cellulose synthase/poly-beta-1,6-N-acetylglucosamine synthase-like glycosyltransferase